MSVTLRVPVLAADVASAVTEREFRRLLGWPRKGDLPEGAQESMQVARRWYAAHGEPFMATRRIDLAVIAPQSVTLVNGDVLAGEALAEYLAAGDAHGIVVVAASAGASVAAEATRLWRDDRPDEGYVLDRFAAAVAEVLLLHASAWCCDSSAPRRARLLRPLSPGCGHWDIVHQRDLMKLLAGDSSSPGSNGALAAIGPVALLESGALGPPHSVLAVCGVAHRAPSATPEAACRECDLDSCNFRRVPFARPNTGPRVIP